MNSIEKKECCPYASEGPDNFDFPDDMCKECIPFYDHVYNQTCDQIEDILKKGDDPIGRDQQFWDSYFKMRMSLGR